MWRNGSRARLRIWWREPWGFESPHPHKAKALNYFNHQFFKISSRNDEKNTRIKASVTIALKIQEKDWCSR